MWIIGALKHGEKIRRQIDDGVEGSGGGGKTQRIEKITGLLRKTQPVMKNIY